MPPSFHWILKGRIAGSGRPGLLVDLDEDAEFLRVQGIRTIVTLTERPLTEGTALDAFEQLHFPIADMGFPMPRDCAVLCDAVLERAQRGPVLLHCRAGLGRTGTVAACCLVLEGDGPAEALARVRSIDPHYVQTPSQEQFIHHFARYVSEAGR